MGLLTAVPAAGLGLAARAAAAAATTVRTVEQAAATGTRVAGTTARVVRGAAVLRPQHYWSAGDRLHVPLRVQAEDAGCRPPRERSRPNSPSTRTC
ncbi:hypothetical protein ACFQZC_04580 [Streptacidiphilus monticola]